VFPGGQGEFHGVLDAKADEIRGHWIQPATVNSMMRYASPVTLPAYGKNHWRGQVVLLEDEFTLFLVASGGEDGTVHAFLRNPDRNLSVFLDVDRMEREGDAVKLIGHSRNEKAERVLVAGTYRSGSDVIAVRIASPLISPSWVQPSTSHAQTTTSPASFVPAVRTPVSTPTCTRRQRMTAGP
jgi:hypothetical protein